MGKGFFDMKQYFLTCPNCGEDMVAARIVISQGSAGVRGSILSAWVCDCNQENINVDKEEAVLRVIKTCRESNRTGKGIRIS